MIVLSRHSRSCQRNVRIYPIYCFVEGPQLKAAVTGDLGPEGYTRPPPFGSALGLKWISTCEKFHPGCKATGKKGFLPSRLIDVGDELVNPSLCITANCPDLP